MIDHLGSNLEHLVIRENPINFNNNNNSKLLRDYLIISLPKMKSFNNDVILPGDRIAAENTCGHLVRLRSLRKTIPTTGIGIGGATTITGNNQLLGGIGIDYVDSSFSASVDNQSKSLQQQQKLNTQFSREFDRVMKRIILDTISKAY